MMRMKKARLFNLLLIFVSVVILGFSSISFFKIIGSIAPDFTVFYGAARDLIAGKNVYLDHSFFTAFNYPPQTAVLYLPFVLFPYSLAQGLVTFLNFCFVPILIWLSLRILKKPFSWRSFLLLTDLAFLSFPVKFTFGMGQSNLFALCLFLLGFLFYKQGKKTACGILLGLAVIAKPTLLFVALFYLFRKQWAILRVFVITIILFSIVPYFLQGASIYQYYFTTQLPELTKHSGLAVYYNQSLLGALSRFTQDSIFSQILYNVGVFCVLWGTLRSLLSNKRNDEQFISRLFIALILLNVMSWQHHFVFLLFPFIVLGMSLRKSNQKIRQLLFLLALFLVSINLRAPTQFMQFPQSIILSHSFFGALILWLLFLPFFKQK